MVNNYSDEVKKQHELVLPVRITVCIATSRVHDASRHSLERL